MKSAVTAFLSYSSAAGLPDRDKVAVLVFSRLVAYSLALPSSPVDTPLQYYVETHTANVATLVSEINEYVVVDVNYLMEITRKVWLARYDLVYRPLSANVNLLVGSIISFDENAFSAELRRVDSALSENGTLARLVSICAANLVSEEVIEATTVLNTTSATAINATL